MWCKKAFRASDKAGKSLDGSYLPHKHSKDYIKMEEVSRFLGFKIGWHFACGQALFILHDEAYAKSPVFRCEVSDYC